MAFPRSLTSKQLTIQQYADKTLSFWCVIERETKYSYILWHVVNRTNIPSKDGHCYRLQDTRTAENCYSDYEDLEWYNIVWHPVTMARIGYLWCKVAGTLWYDEYCSILDKYDEVTNYCFYHSDVYNNSVLYRPEIFIDIVIEFLSVLPTSHDKDT